MVSSHATGRLKCTRLPRPSVRALEGKRFDELRALLTREKSTDLRRRSKRIILSGEQHRIVVRFPRAYERSHAFERRTDDTESAPVAPVPWHERASGKLRPDDGERLHVCSSIHVHEHQGLGAETADQSAQMVRVAVGEDEVCDTQLEKAGVLNSWM